LKKHLIVSGIVFVLLIVCFSGCTDNINHKIVGSWISEFEDVYLHFKSNGWVEFSNNSKGELNKVGEFEYSIDKDILTIYFADESVESKMEFINDDTMTIQIIGEKHKNAFYRL